MSEEATARERRRFQRVALQVDGGILPELGSSRVLWDNGSASRVFDMSFGGVACEKPEEQEFSFGDSVDIALELNGEPSAMFEANVAWFNDRIVGLQITRMPAEARLALRKFLDPKLIGANMVLIPTDMYARDLDCDYWWHGPQETNLYLWQIDDSEALKKATFESLGQILEYVEGVWSLGGGRDHDIQKTYAAVEPDSLDQLKLTEVLDVVSQIKNPPTALKQLVEQLKQSEPA